MRKSVWIILIILVLIVGGYFGYKALFNENSESLEENDAEDFGYGIWSCEEGGYIGGNFPGVGYGAGERIGIEEHYLASFGKIKLCCFNFQNIEEENYKLCLKANDQGFNTHQIAFKEDKKISEVVPWQGLSCTLLYDEKGDWTRSCEEINII